MLIDLLIVIICTLLMSILGIVIFVRNPNNKVNRLFGFLALSISAWTLFNFLSSGKSTNKLALQLVFFFGVYTAFSLTLFMLNFPIENISSGRWIRKIMLYGTAIMSVVVFLPGFIANVTEDNIETGYLYPLFLVF